MAERPALNERFRELRHLDRRHHAGRNTDGFERVHHRERVDDRREHAHGIARHTVHALPRARQPAEDVSAAENNADFDAERMDLLDPLGHESEILLVDALARLLITENFAGQLEQDPAVFHLARRLFHNAYCIKKSPLRQ